MPDLRWILRPVMVACLLGAGKSALVAQAPSPDSLLIRRERAAWDALERQDTASFARAMGGKLVDADASGIRQTTPASVAQYVLGCRTASYSLTDFQVTDYTSVAVVGYKATVDQTCWGQKAPPVLYVISVYERHEKEWLLVAHSETPAARY
jgi:hypothetical protein